MASLKAASVDMIAASANQWRAARGARCVGLRRDVAGVDVAEMCPCHLDRVKKRFIARGRIGIAIGRSVGGEVKRDFRVE